MTINLVDSIDEKLDAFSDNYGTDIIAVFPDRKEIYVEDMWQFLQILFEDWDDEIPVDTDHNLRIVDKSVLTGDQRYQVFLQDDDTGYTIIGEYESASDATEAIEHCHERQYYVTVAMNYEVSVTVTASSLSAAEDIAYNFCADEMTLEHSYRYQDTVDDWTVTDENVEITDSELA